MDSDETSCANPLAAQLSAEGFVETVEIGRGGFGAVYRCREVTLGRVVAVKVLVADLDENRLRFEREQQAMARLTGHPNIVEVLRVGKTADGRPYLVMPYHHQRCLRTRISLRGPVPAEEALFLGIKIAGALESAHRVEIVHRDVKPGNVLITDYGQPALTDFGMAHLTGGYQTQSGVLTASPAFTAPEVFLGDGVNRAADVYGLAATLVYALTGQAPYERRSGEHLVAQVLRITTDPLPALEELSIAPDVAAVLEKAIAKNPTERPDVVEFGQALQQVQSSRGLPVDRMALDSAATSFGNGTHPPAPLTTTGSAPLTHGNLPAPLSSFVGRQAESAMLAALISRSRLVTLTGIGGVGKSKLALQSARKLTAEFPDGVWLVDLGELSDGGLVTGTAATALNICDQPGKPLADVIVDVLADHHALLVVDNCEQVITDTAQLIDALLRGCPRLRVLATSREVLGIGGESVMPLSPLSCPETDSMLVPSDLARYDSVALFVERARAAQPDFALSEHNAAAVVAICTQLDGLPLAIELAVARLRAMSVGQIAERLSDRFDLLTRGRRGAPTRQQTLRWCIGWSYDRCTDNEQRLWDRLSVFAGSFEFDAAHDICSADLDVEDVLDELCELVDKSILIRSDVDGVVRYRLLVTLREFGNNNLSSSERQSLQRTHLFWYRKLVKRAAADWFGEGQADWIKRLRRELPNIREALQFALADSPAAALAITARMHHFFAATGMFQEARRWLDLALGAAPTEATRLRLRVTVSAVMIACMQADFVAAATRIAEARELLETVSDSLAVGTVEACEGYCSTMRGDFSQAQEHFERALAATDHFEVQANARMQMAWAFFLTGEVQRALDNAEQVLALAESRGERGITRTYALTGIFVAKSALGDLKLANRALVEGLSACRASGDTWSGAQFLAASAWVTSTNNDLRHAAVLMAAADTVLRSHGGSATTLALAGAIRDECERKVHEGLSATEFDVAWQEGRSLTFDGAADFALRAVSSLISLC